jgi:hypothetical protein
LTKARVLFTLTRVQLTMTRVLFTLTRVQLTMTRVLVTLARVQFDAFSVFCTLDIDLYHYMQLTDTPNRGDLINQFYQIKLNEL